LAAGKRPRQPGNGEANEIEPWMRLRAARRRISGHIKLKDSPFSFPIFKSRPRHHMAASLQFAQ
jgi:hypothetical protein